MNFGEGGELVARVVRWRHQLLVIVAVTVAQERGLAATSEQPPTKLRQPPVLRWPPLSAFFPRHLLIRGGVRCCPVGRGCRPSPTWMVLPPLLLLPHQHQHHLHLCPHHLLHS